MGNVKTVLKEELRLEKLGFKHNRPEDSYQSQWKECNSILYIVFRGLLAVYQFVVFVYSVCSEPWKPGPTRRHFFLAFITRWTFIHLTAYLVIAFIVATVGYVKYRGDDKSRNEDDSNENCKLENGPASDEDEKDTIQENADSPNIQWYAQLCWFMYEVALCSSFIISLLYWGFVHKSEPFKFDTYAAHAFNSVIMAADFLCNAFPVRILHGVYTMAFSFIYVTFTAIYFSIDPKDNVLYSSVLDWNRPGKPTIISILLIVFVIPLFQTMWFVLYRVKIHIGRILSMRNPKTKLNGHV